MGQLGHLVQEDRTAVRLLEITLAGLQRPRESTLFVAEKLRVDGTLGNGAAVHGDVFVVFAGRIGVHHLRKELLAHAALARHEHRQVGGRDTQRHFERTIEQGRSADDAETLFYGRKVCHCSVRGLSVGSSPGASGAGCSVSDPKNGRPPPSTAWR